MPVTSLTELSAVELRRRIGARQLSPIDLLEACLARIAHTNPAVNAFTATCFDRARAEAQAADAAVRAGRPLGLLHGLPIGIKDLEETEGLLTTYGSPLYRDNIPVADNVLVSRLRQAGAIVVGKTNVPEMGAGANSRNAVWGATGNPFNPALNAGGSSGGSAAALALDMVPLCSGSDTGGSLRIPAAKCGVVGMRTSPGLVPSERKPLGWTGISVVGPMARSIADARLQLAATAGMHRADPLTYAVPADAFNGSTQDLNGLRIGYTEDFGVCDVDDDIRRVFREKIAAIAPLVKSCEPVSFDMHDAHRSFDVIRAQNFVISMRDAYRKDPASLGPNSRANFELGIKMSLEDVAAAHAEQTRIFRKFQALFDRYDLILSPTTPVSPFPWSQLYLESVNGKPLENYYRWLALTYVVTLATNPALSMPCGRDHRGMPFGLQVIGGFREDALLLDRAEALEAAFHRHPELARPIPDVNQLLAAQVDLKSIVTHPPGAAHGPASTEAHAAPV
ncbi:amidase [Alcaligenaceae bacterium C4P045]|nr:amidase [Alcaligenaceae bacterium C4P045]